MKNIVIVFLLIFFKSNAQDFSFIEKNGFETTEDYKKAYETLAKYCADEKNNLKPSKTLKKLIETMGKT